MLGELQEQKALRAESRKRQLREDIERLGKKVAFSINSRTNCQDQNGTSWQRNPKPWFAWENELRKFYHPTKLGAWERCLQTHACDWETFTDEETGEWRTEFFRTEKVCFPTPRFSGRSIRTNVSLDDVCGPSDAHAPDLAGDQGGMDTSC